MGGKYSRPISKTQRQELASNIEGKKCSTGSRGVEDGEKVGDEIRGYGRPGYCRGLLATESSVGFTVV